MRIGLLRGRSGVRESGQAESVEAITLEIRGLQSGVLAGFSLQRGGGQATVERIKWGGGGGGGGGGRGPYSLG